MKTRMHGVIERRLLINYRADPGVVAPLLPDGMRPALVDGHAVAGICMIKLTRLRPAGLPAWAGLTSENAAHRVAVEWDTHDGVESGVYIPRRDTASMVNTAVGGRLYPGRHHHARFRVADHTPTVSVSFASRDKQVAVDVFGSRTTTFSSNLFPSLAKASAFFESGAVGFSPGRRGQLERLTLETNAWKVAPFAVERATSSYFEDPSVFPPGSLALDCGLIMEAVPVSWTPGSDD